MIHVGTRELETDRLRLRRFVNEDYIAMFHQWAKYEKVAQNFPWDAMENLEMAKAKVMLWVGNYTSLDYYHWGIVEKESDELIGTINLKVDAKNDSADTCYIIAPSRWNKGYATEVLKKVIVFGFEEVRLNRIAAEFFEGNEASHAVMMKCGMKTEGTLRQYYLKNGKYIDTTWCSILKSEYKEF